MGKSNVPFFRRLIKLILALGPGIFCIGYTIGTGSVTAMIKSGADFGMAMLWALILSCLFTFFLIPAGHNCIVSLLCDLYRSGLTNPRVCARNHTYFLIHYLLNFHQDNAL